MGFITLAQLLQMLVGMYVTVKAVTHQMHGEECHVNKTNSLLGLAMYFSYFLLFFKLFVDNYCLADRKESTTLPRKPSVSLMVARKASEKMLVASGSIFTKSPILHRSDSCTDLVYLVSTA